MDDSLDISDDELLVRDTGERPASFFKNSFQSRLGIIRHNSVFALLAVIVSIQMFDYSYSSNRVLCDV